MNWINCIQWNISSKLILFRFLLDLSSFFIYPLGLILVSPTSDVHIQWQTTQQSPRTWYIACIKTDNNQFPGHFLTIFYAMESSSQCLLFVWIFLGLHSLAHLILECGDIESNPGPKNVSIYALTCNYVKHLVWGMLNWRYVKRPLFSLRVHICTQMLIRTSPDDIHWNKDVHWRLQDADYHFRSSPEANKIIICNFISNLNRYRPQSSSPFVYEGYL